MSAKDNLDAGQKIVFSLTKGELGYKLSFGDKDYYFDKYADLKKVIDDELKEDNGNI